MPQQVRGNHMVSLREDFDKLIPDVQRLTKAMKKEKGVPAPLFTIADPGIFVSCLLLHKKTLHVYVLWRDYTIGANLIAGLFGGIVDDPLFRFFVQLPGELGHFGLHKAGVIPVLHLYRLIMVPPVKEDMVILSQGLVHKGIHIIEVAKGGP